MIVRFGNLKYPKHNTNHDDSEFKVKEMVNKLTEAGFTRIDNCEQSTKGKKNYHIYDMPHVIEFSSDGEEAVRIMTPYSDYMRPLRVLA